MDFRLLGPLEVRDGDREVRLRGGKQRALLALLLVHANRTLAIDRIVDDLWGEDVPETAAKMVQIYVSRLRKALAPGALHTRPPGYALQLEPGELDLHRFEALVAEARSALAAGRAEEASAGFRAALELWRGQALAEFTSEPFAQAEAARLEELRIAALEGRLESDLLLGRHGDLVGELEALVARHPLREGLRRRHMLALYRSGRQAEALAAYQEARRALADELGIEPSPALRDLERRILRQDASLDLAPPAEPAPVPTPEELPTGAEPAPEEILKLATVLVADVAAAHKPPRERHPEDVRALQSASFTALAEEIRAEGGTVERAAGDAVLAVFGVPSVREDDAVRAVRAACRMVERLRLWNEERDPAEALELRIGLCTGEVLASGAPGGDLRVAGDAVSTAVRLQQAAEPGTIVVAERTARVVRPSFELGAAAAPPGAWIVAGPRDEEREVPAIAAPLVGRDHELAFLQTAFDQVRREGRPALVTVVGDAGVGKSRLARELLVLLEGRATVLVGRCLSSEQAATLGPLTQMLKAEAGVLDSDPSDEASGKIARLVETTVEQELAADPSRTAAGLAATLGLQAPGDALASLDPRELYRRLVEAWRALLASLARQGPVVVVVEDLHWADATTLDVLDELAERLEGPILLLCTARPDLLRSRPDWGGGRRSFSSLPLDPLGAEESARLVSFLPGVDDMPAAVRSLILERSAGNPFFLEEVVRGLIDDGLLV
ncbi:MAG TPA: BTAD domain-containing putative transcriptional regulator, partial [Gaiellaceae bacterium]|nr:BTAD domain-containing putative transcriptional regulator [Gaiellaceae bacterium]